MISGWLNLYKPVGISSAGLVSLVKKHFGKNIKVGHTGTLDVEAEGVLPIAIGEATKLTSFLLGAKKEYRFKVKFGSATDTGDKVGKIIATSHYIPSEKECVNVCKKFLGVIEQVPPKYSALKIFGVPAYKLARAGADIEMKPRKIEVFSLKCIHYDRELGEAVYIAEVSKGTYIRTLAEDISLSLQTVGFVLELARIKVGIFTEEGSVDISSFTGGSKALQKTEIILADIPVIDVDVDIVQQVRYGQKVRMSHADVSHIWLRHNDSVLAIGRIENGLFVSARVLNLVL